MALSVTVSIRAPLSRAGRLVYIWLSRLAPIGFQSAPRSVERGDVLGPRARRAQECFNPRPAQSSGATRSVDGGSSSQGFNPRPAQSSGATNIGVANLQVCAFQSAPRSVERGDYWQRWVASGTLFQSAPRSVERGDLNYDICL